MRNRWSDAEAQAFSTPLEECVYGSRLLGAEPSLVLHGGGNTSVKDVSPDPAGGSVDVIWVKGSSWNLATIEAEGFAPLRLDRLRELLQAPTLSDPQMMSELRCALRDASAPNPSVESLLHAFLPFAAVQHSHADAIVTLSNHADGAKVVREVFGTAVLVLPYVMPGFDLAQAVARAWQAHDCSQILGMVLLHHGLFTFGDTTQQAYERHIALITQAEEYLDRVAPLSHAGVPLPATDPLRLATIRREISAAAGFPVIVQQHRDQRVSRFVARDDLADLSQRGPATPDHVIFTKRLPMLGSNVAEYAAGYAAYYRRNAHRARTPLTMLDPAPRVLLDPELGMLTVGRSIQEAAAVEDIYRHTMNIAEQAEQLGGYQTPSEAELFDVEYWDLEQAKLKRAGTPPMLAGQVALVIGAAHGIGRACAEALLQAGAHVIGWDMHQQIADTFTCAHWIGMRVNVADAVSRATTLRAGIERLGGLDLLIVAADDREELRSRSNVANADVNVEAVASLFAQVHPYLTLSPAAGRVVVIASSDGETVSPLAWDRLAQATARKWADDRIRVNTIHSDPRVNTLTHSVAIGQLTLAMVTEPFAYTTGAQVPVTGGDHRVN